MGYSATTQTHGMFKIDLKAAKKEIWDGLGELKGLRIFGDMVTVAVYCRPVETMGGFLVGNETQIEDVWQGKTGMIVDIGPDCFTEAPSTFGGRTPKVGDWVMHDINTQTLQFSYAGKGWKKTQIKNPRGGMEDTRTWKGWPVRLIQSRYILGVVDNPDTIL